MNIVLTQNSKFNPYSFEEQLKPFLMATQEYRAVEEGLGELSTKAKIYERMANEDPNSQVGKMYKVFSDELSSQAEALTKYGLTPSSRTGLINMKSNFAENIAPIEDAYKRYGESNKYRQSIKSKDNTAVFLRKHSIDDFLNGNTPDDTYISGKDLMARATAESEIAATIVFQEQLSQGKSRTEALETVRAMQDPRLQGITSRAIAGIEGFNTLSPTEQAQLTDYLNKGVYAGMDNLAKGEYQTRQQEEALKLQRSQLALSRERLDLEKEELSLRRDNVNKKDLGIELPDGTYMKNLSGGMVAITNPSTKETKIITSKSLSEERVKQANLGDEFKLDYTGDNFNSSGSTDEFSSTDAVEVRISSLSEDNKKKIERDLKALNLTIDDVVIYKDTDWFSNNHYRVVPKGYNVKGERITSAASKDKKQEETPPAYKGGLL